MESAQKLIEIVNNLSHLQNTSTSTAGVVDNILLIVQELLMLHNDSTALPMVRKGSLAVFESSSIYKTGEAIPTKIGVHALHIHPY